ncbi:MAG: DUF3109 family protein [Saprospiraceae bacterium]|jgi:hypothetical protein|nr:DUF3109 family protein [Saprospiraceae bacterium]
MIIVQDKLVSDELVEEQFICNLSACKGACCWEGDSGAPLEDAELPILDSIFGRVKPFLSPAGIRAIEQQGKYVWFDEAEEYGTPLVDNGPCAYMTLDAGGTAQCGIEAAYRAGAIDFQKPISCHLYPIRVEKNEELGFEALNYHQWDICSAACELGRKEKMPVYRFLREAIVRKYGEEFYEELDGAAKFLKG